MDTCTFAELGLNEQILAGVDALGFTTPTPVQAEAIPAVLAGRDVVASAQTGTGKTAAFALPVLQLILPASRAAREALLETTDPADDFAGGGEKSSEGDDSDDANAVLADSVPDDTPRLSVSPSTSGSADDTSKPRRPRRRHRKKSASAEKSPTAEKGAAGEKRATGKKRSAGEKSPAAETGTDGDAAADNKPRSAKAKRTSKRNSGKLSAGQPNESPSASASLGPDAKPKRRRKRRKKKPATPANDSRAKNPDARPFGPFALVITPTRELAQQIDRVVSVVCEHTGQRAAIVMGGAKFDRQIRTLEEGCDMLVATPGRLIDLMEHDHVDLSHVQVLVLDEADRMLDMGFWPSVRRIMAALPRERQNLLFSATIPPSIKATIDAMLNDPAYVEIARVGETADTVEEHLCPVTQGQKTQLLKELIRTGGANREGTSPANPSVSDGPEPPAASAGIERVLVFCRTKQRVDDVSRTLKAAGFLVEEMHADRPQKARERALERFRAGKCQVLVATDVMSRGIDVSGIDAVVNFDVPLDPEDYVHRVGRTGRAGATGHAYTFVAPDEISPMREIEYFTGKLVPTWDLPGLAYDDGRIVLGATRSTVKPKRTMFSGMRSRGRGMYGRHY